MVTNHGDELPDRFKMTEVGPLPEGWRLGKFDSVVMGISTGDWGETDPGTGLQQCYVLRGTDFSQALKGSFTNTPVRYLKTSSIQKRQLGDGDILVELSGGSKDQPTGRIMMISDEIKNKSSLPLVHSNFVKRLDLKTDLWPEFFWQYWEHLYQNGVTRIYEKRTTGIRNFKLNDFLTSEHILLPPLIEQKAIAHVLSVIQKAIEAQDKIIAAAKDLKRSLVHHLFAYGPVPFSEAERVPLKETEIGLIPEHWDVVRLGEVVHKKDGIKRGPWGGSLKKEIFVPAGYKVYEQKNVIANDFSIGSYFIDDNKFRELEDFEVRSGDILITAAGTLGKVAIVPENADKGIVNQALLRLRVNEDVISKLYFQNAFNRLVDYRFLEGMSHGATLKNLSSVAVLRNIPIPLPLQAEQQEIIRILSTTDRKIESEENHKRALQALFKTMLHLLMTGKLRAEDVEVPAS